MIKKSSYAFFSTRLKNFAYVREAANKFEFDREIQMRFNEF